ncbi:phosphonoacetaldehyde reductase [Campylobacter sp. 2457A]|uniref:phosphonoacetaldehyde reductase n=1 Tax=Campylobacter sp. 2457A TaxID=2735784 RepID=UPI00301E3050|nr:phosphonoacetaldehyde reductase [Campylobacter sp. 2457A]
MNFKYYNPVKMNFNVEYTKVLDSLKTNSILLITSKSFYEKGFVGVFKERLGQRLKAYIFNIASNPEIEFVKELKKEFDGYSEIIALGGGSVLDAAKYFSVSGEILKEGKDLKISKNSSFIPIYAIPTTAGTSSELTQWATFWDSANNIKFSLSNENLYCKEAFYDPNLYLNIPKDLTIYTALDALSHSIESIWNKNSNDISTNHAIKAIELILKYLPQLQNNLNSKELRLKLILASIYAGLAFSNTQTALAHAISYPLTMQFRIPHGLACSFTIPILLECISDENSILLSYKKDIIDLFDVLNISTNFKDYKITKKDFENIFSNLNSRAKNGLFNLEKVKQKILSCCENI